MAVYAIATILPGQTSLQPCTQCSVLAMKALKRAATNPSQASHGKLVRLYRIKNGVTLKCSTSEQIIIANNQPNSQTFQRQLECSPLSSGCSPGPAVLFKQMSRICLQLFGLQTSAILIPCIYSIVPHGNKSHDKQYLAHKSPISK